MGTPETPRFSSLREKMAWEKEQRLARYAGFEVVVQKADAAGLEAARTEVPAPMVVVQHENPLDDTSAVVKGCVHSEGVCGFAWIRLSKGNTSFAVWAKKHAGFQASRSSMGTYRWVSEFRQSYERKTAYAQAYAEILRENGIVAFAGGRLD